MKFVEFPYHHLKKMVESFIFTNSFFRSTGFIVGIGRGHRGLHNGESCEALLGAFVLGQGQGISGGGPAHHIHHFQASTWIATDFPGDKKRWMDHGGHVNGFLWMSPNFS